METYSVEALQNIKDIIESCRPQFKYIKLHYDNILRTLFSVNLDDIEEDIVFFKYEVNNLCQLFGTEDFSILIRNNKNAVFVLHRDALHSVWNVVIWGRESTSGTHLSLDKALSAFRYYNVEEDGDSEQEPLIQEAVNIRKKAYTPYSNFKVGASILSDVGIHSGCNIENASYGCTSCAEASAISDMIKAGGTHINMVCVSGEADNPVTPCGMCRQRIREFSDENTKIIIVDSKSNILMTTTLDTLLPNSFGPEYLKK